MLNRLGSGGGMSIEDVFVLSTLIEKAKTLSEALTALGVYDKLRRPRTQTCSRSKPQSRVYDVGTRSRD